MQALEKTLRNKLERTVMEARDVAELGFIAANETWHLTPYRQACFFVTDLRNRVWKAVTDSSINAAREFQAEVVSPVLAYEDLDQLVLRHLMGK